MGNASSSRPGTGTSVRSIHATDNQTTVREIGTPNPKTSTATNVAVQPQVQSIPPQSNGKANFLILYHSSDSELAQEIQQRVENASFAQKVVLVDESGSMRYRDTLMRWADMVVMVVSYDLQRNPFCIELANYAKVLQKKMVTIVKEDYFDPSGSIGALSKAYGPFIRRSDDALWTQFIKLSQDALPDKPIGSSQNAPEIVDFEGGYKFLEKVPGDSVYISYTEDGKEIADMVKNGKGVGQDPNNMSDLTVVMGDPSSVDEDRVKQCQVFIPILTPRYETSDIHRKQYDFARRNQKAIIPVKATKFEPAGWLGLAIAGKLYYEMHGERNPYEAYKIFADSCPMNDFILSVKSFMGERYLKSEDKEHPTLMVRTAAFTEDEREKLLVTILSAKTEELKSQLSTWPPEDFLGRIKSTPPPTKAELLPQEELKLPLNYIPYSVSRMNFIAPKNLYDENGLRIEKQFDCMMSYSWSIQSFVYQLFLQLHMKNLNIWLDLWGGMNGNINESMANGVENSNSIVVFLNQPYLKSVNCNFELRYALILQKPIIFVMIPDWIKPTLDKSLVLNISGAADLGTQIMGYPKINVLSLAIQAICTWKVTQPMNIPRNVSAKVYELQINYENGKTQLADEVGCKRFEKCTRCHGDFDPDTKSGCKRHGAYFMGGNILAGRWVCCQMTGKDGPGCEACDHTTQERTWADDVGGTHRWRPA